MIWVIVIGVIVASAESARRRLAAEKKAGQKFDRWLEIELVFMAWRSDHPGVKVGDDEFASAVVRMCIRTYIDCVVVQPVMADNAYIAEMESKLRDRTAPVVRPSWPPYLRFSKIHRLIFEAEI